MWYPPGPWRVPTITKYDIWDSRARCAVIVAVKCVCQGLILVIELTAQAFGGSTDDGWLEEGDQMKTPKEKEACLSEQLGKPGPGPGKRRKEPLDKLRNQGRLPSPESKWIKVRMPVCWDVVGMFKARAEGGP